jgi:RP/EB family microtubule-associated protein
MAKLNMNARYPEDYARNLRVLDDAFTKLRIERVLSVEAIAKGKFQENMTLL